MADAKTTRKGATKRPSRRREYLVDERGRCTAVVLPVKEYEALVEAAEQLDDIRHLDEARTEGDEPVPWEQVKAELRAQGKLP